MNIFVVDNDPYKAARDMCDKHINKMIIESNQIASCVIDFRSGDKTLSQKLSLPQYPKAHAKHPCTIWAMESRANAQWLIKHLHGLEQEFKKRYPRTEHKLKNNYKIYAAQLEDCTFDKEELTPFAQAMPEQYKVDGNAVAAYRTYYLMDKSFAAWKKGAPKWFADSKDQILTLVKGLTKVA